MSDDSMIRSTTSGCLIYIAYNPLFLRNYAEEAEGGEQEEVLGSSLTMEKWLLPSNLLGTTTGHRGRTFKNAEKDVSSSLASCNNYTFSHQDRGDLDGAKDYFSRAALVILIMASYCGVCSICLGYLSCTRESSGIYLYE